MADAVGRQMTRTEIIAEVAVLGQDRPRNPRAAMSTSITGGLELVEDNGDGKKPGNPVARIRAQVGMKVAVESGVVAACGDTSPPACVCFLRGQGQAD